MQKQNLTIFLSCTHNCSLIYLFLKEKHTINKKQTPNGRSLNFHIMFKAFNIKSDSTFACFKSFSKHILHIYFSKLKCARPKVLRSTFWEIYKMPKIVGHSFGSLQNSVLRKIYQNDVCRQFEFTNTVVWKSDITSAGIENCFLSVYTIKLVLVEIDGLPVANQNQDSYVQKWSTLIKTTFLDCTLWVKSIIILMQ